jgi:hypothetical protein
MGYKYYHSNQILISEIINKIDNKRKRINYLIEKRRLEEKYPDSVSIYIGETFVHKNYVKYKILRPFNNSKKIRFKFSGGKGNRFSIIRAGSEIGFVEEAEQIFINNEKFENWLQNKLLPNLPPNSIVVFDKASTHSRQYNKPRYEVQIKIQLKNGLF